MNKTNKIIISNDTLPEEIIQVIKKQEKTIKEIKSELTLAKNTVSALQKGLTEEYLRGVKDGENNLTNYDPFAIALLRALSENRKEFLDMQQEIKDLRETVDNYTTYIRSLEISLEDIREDVKEKCN